MAIKTIKKTSEDEAQAHICCWCVQNNLVPVSVPNGFNLGAALSLFKKYGLPTKELNMLNAKQIAMLKREGLHTGFPDMLIFGFSNSGLNVLFMENKVKNNKPSEIQLLCHDFLRELGFTVEISKNSVDAITKIKSFFGSRDQEINKAYLAVRRGILSKKKEVQNEIKENS